MRFKLVKYDFRLIGGLTPEYAAQRAERRLNGVDVNAGEDFAKSDDHKFLKNLKEELMTKVPNDWIVWKIEFNNPKNA